MDAEYVELPRMPMAWGSPAELNETEGQMLCRIRRRLAAAGTRGGKSWEDLFVLCDRNRDGQMEYRELENLVRKELKIPSQTVCDVELRALFAAVDRDGTGTVDAAEFLEYVQHGPRRPQDDAARFEQRIQRVQRNMRMAWQCIGGNDADGRKLFHELDLDGSNRLSMYEFNSFVRNKLGLTRWDVQNAALADFFAHLDKDGDGMDITELIAYLRQVNKEKTKVGPQSLYMPPKTAQIDRKCKTFKQKLETSIARSASLPSLGGFGVNRPASTSAFSNVGRTRPPMVRECRPR